MRHVKHLEVYGSVPVGEPKEDGKGHNEGHNLSDSKGYVVHNCAA